MLLLDLLDTIIKFMIGIIPITIALISLFVAYYYYIKNPMYSNNKIENNELNNDLNGIEQFKNIFYNRECHVNKNGQCKFNLTKHFSFECPKTMCSDKKENFVNHNFLNQNIMKQTSISPNNVELSKIITSNIIKDETAYTCFDGNDCITKRKDFTKPWDNNCGSPYISDYQNTIYTSEDECYKANIEHKYFNKKECLEMSNGYGWLDGEGCVKGTPEGPANKNSSFFLYGINKKNYTPSIPNHYVLPLYEPHYDNTL
jgi:hypothetical protein